jgi:uncharacterized protein YcnI
MHRPIGVSLCIAALSSFALSSSPVWAHATLERDQAPAGSFYKAVIGIPHGCAGAATQAVRVLMPDGVKRPRPMPKPGWALETRVENLATPYDWYGTTITEDVREIVWSGGSLRDDFYDEFVFMVKLPDTEGATLYFKTVQVCDKGEHRWIEVPEPGKTLGHDAEPAPSLILTKPEASH